MKHLFIALILMLTGCSSTSLITDCPHNVYNHSLGGLLIDHAELHFVFWGDYWRDTSEVKSYMATWDKLTNNGVLDRLQEYGIGAATLDKTPYLFYQTVSDNMDEEIVQSNISFEINEGFLPSPNSETIYIIFLPPNITTKYAGTSFSGYHLWYFDYMKSFPYAVILHDDSFVHENETVSHEIYEATTDPTLRQYFSDQGGESEIGDFCEKQVALIDDIKVQKVWSTQSCVCL